MCHWDVCRGLGCEGTWVREVFLPSQEIWASGPLHSSPNCSCLLSTLHLCWGASNIPRLSADHQAWQEPHGQYLGWWSRSMAQCISAKGVSLSRRLGYPALSIPCVALGWAAGAGAGSRHHGPACLYGLIWYGTQ